MRDFCKVLSLLLAITFAMVAQPTLGQATVKLYSFTMVADQTNGTTKMVAVVTNSTPPTELGNAQFSSVDIFVDNLPWKLDITAGATIVQSSGKIGAISDFSQQGHLKISNLYPVKPQEYVTVTFYLNSAGDTRSCGEGRWGVTAYTGSNFSGDVFAPVGGGGPIRPLTVVTCGALACNDTPFTVNYASLITGRRGQNSDQTADTSQCQTAVTYSVTDLLPAKLHFRWNVTAAPLAVFRYTIADTSPSTIPQVAWLTQGGASANDSEATPAFITALSCIAPSVVTNPVSPDNYLPFAYGSLAAAVLPTDTKIKVAAFAVPTPALPFDFVIGTERMRVTKIVVSTGTWTVQRNIGEVPNTPIPGHALGDAVMSTPFRLLGTTGVPAPYVAGTVAKMCFIRLNDGNISFIDGGDGWYSIGGGN